MMPPFRRSMATGFSPAKEPLISLYALATASHFEQGEARSTAVYSMYTREE